MLVRIFIIVVWNRSIQPFLTKPAEPSVKASLVAHRPSHREVFTRPRAWVHPFVENNLTTVKQIEPSALSSNAGIIRIKTRTNGKTTAAHGTEYIIVGPSKLPRQPCDRVKTDLDNADQLARLLRCVQARGSRRAADCCDRAGRAPHCYGEVWLASFTRRVTRGDYSPDTLPATPLFSPG